MKSSLLHWSVAAAWLVGCGSGTGDTAAPSPVGFAPEFYCPGTADCPGEAAGSLRAGVGQASVTPNCFEDWDDLNGDATYEVVVEPFHDCGCDRLCPDDPGYPGPDEGEGDGEFQAVWMAGFGNARAATGVRDHTLGLRGEGDGLQARAIVVEQAQTRVGLVAIDAMGWMYDDVRTFRAAVEAAGHDLDLLVVHSSHGHEGPDTMGIYGPSLTTTGYSSAYAEQTAQAVVDAVADAVAGLTEVTVSLGRVDAGDYWDNGVQNLIRDSRDPWIVDPRVNTARFTDSSGNTVATLIHFANHPETVADKNTLLTADFVHALRETVEDGVTWGSHSRNGVGGMALYLNAAVGGMMTSLGAEVHDPDGNVWSEASFEKADVVGQLLGEMALDAVESDAPTEDQTLSFRGSTLHLPVENTAFQAMFQLGVLDHRSLYNYDETQPLGADNRGEVQTEVDLVRIGGLSILTMPGELLPELAIGGYDGRFTPPGVEIVDPSNDNPPDLTAAPEGPYLVDRLDTDQGWILGLANDELGYIIPPYNFIVSDTAPYLFEADGDHYEETNSLGPQTAPLLQDLAVQLIDWEPATP